HVEVLFGYIVVFALENFFEAAHCLSNGYVLSLVTGEDLGDVKRLAEKSLNLPRTIYGQLVLRTQFIHSKDGDDVLKIFVSLQYSLHISSNVVMIFADNLRGEYFGCRCQRIDCWINSEFGDGALKYNSRIQVRKSVCRRRIREIVRWNIDRLERSDRSFFR